MNRLSEFKENHRQYNFIHVQFMPVSLKRGKKRHVKGVQQLRERWHTKVIQVYTHHCGVTFNCNCKVRNIP
jgi:hypothetical protein